jgi:hypothetical protein
MLRRKKPWNPPRVPIGRRKGKRGRSIAGAFPVESPERSEKYLDWIRDQPCLVCGRPPRNEAHHEPKEGDPNMARGRKVSDYRTLPLCGPFGCHGEIDNGRKAAWTRWGIDPEAVIERLNAEYRQKVAA